MEGVKVESCSSSGAGRLLRNADVKVAGVFFFLCLEKRGNKTTLPRDRSKTIMKSHFVNEKLDIISHPRRSAALCRWIKALSLKLIGSTGSAPFAAAGVASAYSQPGNYALRGCVFRQPAFPGLNSAQHVRRLNWPPVVELEEHIRWNIIIMLFRDQDDYAVIGGGKKKTDVVNDLICVFLLVFGSVNPFLPRN